jgi:Fic family protein
MPEYKKGVPFDLPKLPPKIDYSVLVELLSNAHAALARLDETLSQLHNPQLIERTFLTREAVLSSQIEGTQATLEEVLKQEAEQGKDIKEENEKERDIREIINYRMAMRQGVKFIDEGQPLSENRVKELHKTLLQSVRGKTRAPGEFRRKQVWIGSPGTPMEEARYVPPSPVLVPEMYGNFDRYLNTEDAERDVLVQIAVSHYQFEALHPFEDGNGRVGRLIIPLFLYQRHIIAKPYLYISKYLEEHRRDYYDLLADISYKGEWIPWIRFFLNGLCEQAKDASNLARKIIQLEEHYQAHLREFNSPYAFNILKAIFTYPIITSVRLREAAEIDNIQTGINLLAKFVKAGILVDISPERKRNKTYAFKVLLDLIENYSPEENKEHKK